MFGLLMLQAELSGVGRPSSIAPTAFDLVRMVGTIVEVITHAICGKGTATALRHDLTQRLLRSVRTVCECLKEPIRHYTRDYQASIHKLTYEAAKLEPLKALICLQRCSSTVQRSKWK